MADPLFTNPLPLPDGLAMLAWLDARVSAEATAAHARSAAPGVREAVQARAEMIDWCRALVSAAMRRDTDDAGHAITAGFTALDGARLLSVAYAHLPGYDPRWRPRWR